jgi:hypothetical protein
MSSVATLAARGAKRDVIGTASSLRRALRVFEVAPLTLAGDSRAVADIAPSRPTLDSRPGQRPAATLTGRETGAARAREGGSVVAEPGADEGGAGDAALLAVEAFALELLQVGRLRLDEQFVDGLQIDGRQPADVQPHAHV